MNPFSEDHLVERPTMELLIQLGWETVNAYDEVMGKDGNLGRHTTSEVVLTRYLYDSLKRLNSDVDMDAIEVAIEELTKDRSTLHPVTANQEIYRMLKDGIQVVFHDAEDEEVETTLKIIDWETPENNHYLAVNQLWITGMMYKRRTDVIGFVNGIPLVFMELKGSHRRLEDAFNDNLRDYKDTIPQIFWYNAFIIISNGSRSRAGTITAEMEHFAEWKKIDSEKEEGTVSLETMICGMCTKDRLIDIVENFVLYQDGIIKLLAKNHQYHGVNNAIRAVQNIKSREGRLGVFWHTQGSGKSFSMVFFSQKVMRKIPGNWTFIVVTDRTDLDDQIYKNFVSTGTITENNVQANSCVHLKQLLSEDHKVVFTLIHKFQWEGISEPVTLRDDVIVITDEAHRSQYDTLAANMRRVLPNASFIGFTGTPLMEGDNITREVFGDYVSVYNFTDAIEDKATVPLYYENRIPELQLINESLNDDLNEVIENAMLDEEQEKRLEREFGREYHLITREERLDRIAEDIVSHFMGRGYLGKAMVVSIDKVTALRMYFKVKDAWDKYIKDQENQMKSVIGFQRDALAKKIAYMKETDMAVVISPSQNEVDDFRKKGMDILPIRRRMQEEDLDVKFKDPANKLRLVFVCAMWITGFDVPPLSTVYLDKPMKNHTLMQTIARANRVFGEKNNGLIVDYIGVFRNLQKALAIYAKPSGEGGLDAPIKDKESLLKDLENLIGQIEILCSEHEVNLKEIIAVPSSGFGRIGLMDEAVERLLVSDETKRRYMQLARLCWRVYKAILPDSRVAKHEDICLLIKSLLEKIHSLNPVPDISEVMDDIGEVLDVSIDSKGYIIRHSPEESIIDLSGLDFEKMKIEFAKKHKRIELEKLSGQVERVLESMMEMNRTRMDYMEKFQQMIDEYNAGSKNVDLIYRELVDFAEKLSEEQKRHIAEQLSEEELAVFDILTLSGPDLTGAEVKDIKKIARSLLVTLKQEKLVLDWRKRQNTRADVLYTIETILDDELPRSYSTDLYKEKCEQVYEHIFDSYFDNGKSVYDAAS